MASVQASDAPLGAVALDTIAAAAATPPLNAAIVKEAMAKHDDRRHARRGKPRAESKSFRPRFYTKEQLEEKAPSIQAGMAPEKYARAQRQYTIMIKEMCQKMRHTSSINFAAVSFCHLFYAVRVSELHHVDSCCIHRPVHLCHVPILTEFTAMTYSFSRASQEAPDPCVCNAHFSSS
jgi:hypothetical protein